MPPTPLYFVSVAAKGFADVSFVSVAAKGIISLLFSSFTDGVRKC